MSSMIERVARAIRAVVSDDYEDLSDPVKRIFKAEARAAIEAMRDPTETMYCAGDEEILAHLNSEKFIKGEDTPAVDCWKAMIDDALVDHEKHGE